jgi:nitrogenase molybdenum-iron protein alpha/beta subunit
VNPHCAAPIVWFVNYPWEDRRGAARTAQTGRQIESLATAELVTTELDESDVILGNPDKLDRALAYAVRAQAKHGKTIFFSNTCVPVVTGEDVESRVDKVRASCGCPMLYLTVTPRSMVNVFQEILVDRRLAAEAVAPPPAAGVVNLIGFAARRDLDELRGLMETCGVTVNCVLLPDLDPALVDRLPAAGINVLRPNNLWQNLYDQVLYSSRTPAISPQAPYGVESTRRWLGEVAAAAGVPGDAERAWLAAFAPLEAAWEALRREASGHRLALVVRGEETYHLTRPASTWGIPLVAVLEELGFGLDVLIRVEDRASAYKAASEVRGVFTYPDRHVIKGFNTFELLLRRLAESPAQAVLSSHFFDWRVTASGKSLFSLQYFEMGLAGALRTGERLLDVCRTPFYRRYARHLARTRSGLRGGPGTGAGEGDDP